MGRRFKGFYDYFIAGSFFAVCFLCALTIGFLTEFEDANFVMIAKLNGYFVLWVLLLAPSIHYALFYAIVFLVTNTVAVLENL